MKFNRMKVLLTLITGLLMLNGYSQDFKIENSNGSKKIRKTDIVELRIGEINEEDKNCCEYNLMRGNIKSINGDSVMINVSNLSINNVINDSNKAMTYNWENENKLKSISKKDIIHLTRYKSKRERKFRNGLSATGAILLVGGAITALNTLMVEKKGNRKNLLLLGSIEMGAGFIIGLSSVKKKYYFKNSDDPWEFSN